MVDKKLTKQAFGIVEDFSKFKNGYHTLSYVVVRCDECGNVMGKKGRVLFKWIMKKRSNSKGDVCLECHSHDNNPLRDFEEAKSLFREIVDNNEGVVPARDELPGSLVGAINRYHGKYEQFILDCGLELTKKRVGYWNDFNNFKGELLPLCTLLGKMPSQKWLLHHGYFSLRAAFKYHGGVKKVAKELGYKIETYIVAKDGHYCFSYYEEIVDNLFNLYDVPHEREPEIEERDRRRGDFRIGDIYIECFGIETRYLHRSERARQYLANFSEKLELYKKNGIELIILYPKDFAKEAKGVRRKLSGILKTSNYEPTIVEVKNSIMPSSEWAKWTFYKSKVKELIEINKGVFPLARRAEELGYSTIYHYASKYHGGISSVKRRLGYEVSKEAPHYWKDFKNVKKQFLPVCKKLGYFPTAQMIRDKEHGMIDCVTSLYEFHNGISAIAKELGYPTKNMFIADRLK